MATPAAVACRRWLLLILPPPLVFFSMLMPDADVDAAPLRYAIMRRLLATPVAIC